MNRPFSLALAAASLFILRPGVAGPAALTSAQFSVGDVTVEWASRRGLSIHYRGAAAFLPYADEFTVHNRKWTRAFYRMRTGRSTATLTRRGDAQVLAITDADEHFFYKKTVTVEPGGRVRVEFEYGQRGLQDARLQLGWRPSVAWLSGAQFEVVDSGKPQTGRMTTDYSGRRVLWPSLTRMAFTSVFGKFTMTSTRGMTLYDYRQRRQFWLGWDHELKDGETYKATVELRFEPFQGEIAGMKVAALTWTREVLDGYLTVTIDLARAPGGPGRVRCQVACKPDERTRLERTAEARLTDKPTRVTLRLPVARPGAFSAALDLLDPASGRVWYSLQPLNFEVRPTLRFFAALSLYTSESDVELVVRVDDAVPLDGLSLRCREPGQPARTVSLNAHESVLRVPASAFRDGLHVLTAELVRGRDVIGAARTRFCKAPPKPNEVKIDRRTGGLIVDGEPFFPFGFYVHRGAFYDQGDLPRYVLDLEAPFKFNLICPYHNFDRAFRKKNRARIAQFLDRADAVGLKVHYDIRQMCDRVTQPGMTEAIADDVAAHRDAPALLCWYLSDEPAGRRIPPAQFIALYPKLKALDPHHPATMVFCVPKRAHEYADALDILMVDPYPIPNSPVTRVSETVDLVRRTAPADVAIWCVPQAFGGGEGWGREPTPREERCMTYLAIVHGATGIQYFIRRPPMNNPFVGALWGEIRAMASEIKALTPVLLSREPSPHAMPVPADPSIHVTARRYAGEAFMLCVNSENRPRRFAVQCNAKPCEPTARVLFEDRTVPVSRDGRIEDLIDGYGVRIYAYRVTPPPKPRAPKATNLLRNGGFEQQANVGYPDYFHFGQGKDQAASWGTDPLEAYEGRHALFIRCPSAGAGPSVTSYPMRLGPGPYRVTVYLKADRPDFAAAVSVGGGKQPARLKCVLGPKWKLFALDFEGPAKPRRVHFSLRPESRGMMWADAIRVSAR